MTDIIDVNKIVQRADRMSATSKRIGYLDALGDLSKLVKKHKYFVTKRELEDFMIAQVERIKSISDEA